jgi:hypothetical protein
MCGVGSSSSGFPRGYPILIRVGELEEHIVNCQGRRDSELPTTFESPAWLIHFLRTRSLENGWLLKAEYFDKKMHEPDTYILLDGLDEASDGKVRARLARIVEKATRVYPECHFVVTTRLGAYQGLSTIARFVQVKVQELSDSSVEQFLQNWSSALHSGDHAASSVHREELLSALRARPAIRKMARNPVMLTALAVLHWNERRLPEQRAELYDSILGWLARTREKPGRERAERCLALLGHLALAMRRSSVVARVWLGEDALPSLFVYNFGMSPGLRP